MNSSTTQRTLRIIGGNCRRRKVTFPDIASIRPTPNRIRETLFNWIAPHLPGSQCLELFGGSGILSMEALSRGAGSVTIIDESRQIIEHISEQMKLLDMDSTSFRLHQDEALNWLDRHSGLASELFNIVFLDPPFSTNLLEQSCQRLAAGDFLDAQALIYIESNEPLTEFALPTGWTLHRTKSAGAVHYGLCKTT
jgi:16S rRNA (guanine966-N2)-methyltransferase